MVSVIIVNFNGGGMLLNHARCLLDSHLDESIEVIVVDNASRDNSMALLDALGEEAPITRVYNERNMGFAAGCNIGIQAAHGEWLLFLNPDCAVQSDTIAIAVDALRANPNAKMAGCLLRNEDGTEQRGCRRDIPDPKQSFFRVSGLSKLLPRRFPDFNAKDRRMPERASPVEAISGAFMLMPREALDAVGHWDEGYFLHCEDLDLCQRFGDQGHTILFVPAAHATHMQGSSTGGRPIFVEWHKHQGMWRFYQKFQAPNNLRLFNMVVAIGIVAHFAMRALKFMPGILRAKLRTVTPGGPV
jgi:GT2 family glycosyltransferase